MFQVMGPLPSLAFTWELDVIVFSNNQFGRLGLLISLCELLYVLMYELCIVQDMFKLALCGFL